MWQPLQTAFQTEITPIPLFLFLIFSYLARISPGDDSATSISLSIAWYSLLFLTSKSRSLALAILSLIFLISFSLALWRDLISSYLILFCSIPFLNARKS